MKFLIPVLSILKFLSLVLGHLLRIGISIRDKKTEVLAKDLNLSYEATVDSAFLRAPEPFLPKDLSCLIDTDKRELVTISDNQNHLKCIKQTERGCLCGPAILRPQYISYASA